MLRTYKDDHDFYSTLPKKRVGACALLFYKGELLIVQPTYNPGWILPGGTVQAEESPLEGLQREVQEELSLSLRPRQILSVDYVFNLDVKGEYIQFLFSADDLSEKEVQRIVLDPYELKDFTFVGVEKALRLLAPVVSRRVESTLWAQEKSKGAIYLENGRPPFEISTKEELLEIKSL